ncbi:hypothetical protein I3842_08G171400 [Carya illinoinensis]|uniref:AAA+ ATPase domain-containing protein n=1 Tax=Carya illinoinensis TaxID=32201 RepID=A0A922EE53_CARIL|nr:hypothetical protein I3842_08G171400 [Carya illinoinensis]
MEIVIAVVAKIVEYAIGPVGQWLCYSCHYNSNMENLKNLETTLRDAKNRVQRAVNAASNSGEEIEDDVNTWLTKVDGILHQLTIEKLDGGEVEAKSRNFNASCLNLKQRHQLSRKAKKLVGNIAELLKNVKYDTVSHCPPSQNMVPERSEDYMTFGSRELVMKGIKEALGDANINKVGVSGPPGVGKSTLMEEIRRQAREEWLFDEVALVIVTDSPNTSRIQVDIADMLNLKFEPNETEIKRADRLQRRLQKDNKILVILDDIWKKLDLKAIGIPSKGCKLLMTSRDQRVLDSHMGTERNFKLNILGEEEAWNLFEKMAGDSIKDDLDLRNVATKVAIECGGLPIALVTVSKALKGHNKLGIWKDALVQLRRPPPEHDTEIWSTMYSCIELSYKHLVSKEVQSLFLLCARQDYYISYRDLLRYGFGLCLFHGIVTLEDARNRLEILVSKLQDSGLLLQTSHSFKEFYMHDVVRHVATTIALNDHNMFVMRGDGGLTTWPNVDALKKCEALSIHGAHHSHKYPNKIECPKLRYFHVQCSYLNPPSSTSFQGMDKLEDIFFQGMDKLEVVSLTNVQLSSLLPLTNLQTLCLDGCELGDIHWIGKLKTLVILSLARSDISNLPREIESLTRLRLLDLSYCFRLRVIPPNVLSSLVDLEELYMRAIKVEWDVEGPYNEGKNASLAELKKLSHLTTLEIDILDANNLPEDLFAEKFERYQICIGDIREWGILFKERECSRTLILKVNMSFKLDFGIKMLLKRTEYLYLDGSNRTKSVLYELNREDFQKLKHLHIQNDDDIKHILELRTPAVAFPILQTFVLKYMIGLEEICQGNLTLASFKNLKVLEVANCEKLRFIFSSSIARGLSLLEKLNITRCKNVGAIFVKEEEDGIEDQGDMMLFGRLQNLVLEDLPKLVGFLSSKDSFMADCIETNSEGSNDLQLPLLHHDQVSFPSLQTLRMKGLPKIKYVWSCGQEPKTVIRCLEQLQVLEIEDCGVEEIVAVERGEAIAIRTSMFPQVTKLKFSNLPRLMWFYKGVHVSKWPMLKEMAIQGCHKVEIFASEVVSFEKAVEDQRQSEMSNIKQPFFSVDEHSFPSLKTLKISNMDLLEFIFGKLEGQNGKESQDLISPASGTEESGATTHFVSTLSFPSLKKLDITGMDKLEIVWQDQVAATSFPNIPNANNLLANFFSEKLERYRICIGVQSYHGNFMSRVLKLKLNLSFQLDVGIKMLMKRTEYLYLDEENSSKSVLYEVDREDFQQLKHLHIQNNDNIKHIFELGTSVVAFPVLETFVLKNMFSLEEISQGKLPFSSFKNLKVLKVHNCEKLRFIFSSSIARGLSLLKELRIKRCNNVGAIFVKEEEYGIEDQGDMMLFGRLQTLVLMDLPKLVGFLCAKDSFMTDCRETNSEGSHDLQLPLLHHDQVSFPSLQTLRMKGLPKIKYVWSCGQEPKTVIRCLEQLQVLEIEDCGVEEIVAFERGGEAVAIRTLMFPQVTKLKFRNLSRLKWFYKGVHVSKWPMLKKMKIERCEKVEIFASEVVSFGKTVEDQRQSEMSIKQPLFLVNELSFPSLEELLISNMDSLEIIFGKLEGQNGKEPQDLISPASGTEESGATTHFVSTLSFPSLKKLHIWKMDKLEIIWQDQVAATSFSNIQELIIVECAKLLHVFQSNLHTTTTLMQSLNSLRITDCDSLETIFRNMEGQNGKESQVLTAPSSGLEESIVREDGTTRHIEFPTLTKLSFVGLPKLKWIFKGVHTNLECPSLKQLQLGRFGQVINMNWASKFPRSSSSQENQLQTCIQQPIFVFDEVNNPILSTTKCLIFI